MTCLPSISRALRVSSGNGHRPPLTSSLRKHSGQKPRARQEAWPGYGAIPCKVRAVTGIMRPRVTPTAPRSTGGPRMGHKPWALAATSGHSRARNTGRPEGTSPLVGRFPHHRPSKLVMRVRFPSPAPTRNRRSAPYIYRGWQQTRVLVKAVDIANPGAQLVPAPRWRIVPRHRRRGAQHLA